MEWRLSGEKTTIINHRLHDAYVVDKASNNLYPLPQELFDMPRAEPIAESLLHNDEEKFTPPKTFLTESSEVNRVGAKILPFGSSLKALPQGHANRFKKKLRFADDNTINDLPKLDDEDDSDDEDNFLTTNQFLQRILLTRNSPKETSGTGAMDHSSAPNSSTPSIGKNTESDRGNTTKSIQNLWHQRLGHPNNRRLREMANNPIYTTRGFPALTSRQLDMTAVCDACMIGKSTTVTSHRDIEISSVKGQSWSIDLTGRKDTPALGNGAHIGVVLMEHSTRFSVTYTIENNDEANVLRVLKAWNDEYLSLVKSWHSAVPDMVYFLHADNLEMKYSKVEKYLTSIGVKPMFTAPDHSSSNGIAERLIRTLDTTQRILRLQKDLPDEFWGTAFHHANFLRCRMPFTYRGQSMPDPQTAFYGHTFWYPFLRIYGSTCWVHARDIPKTSPHRAFQGIFVGFQPNSNTYLVYLPSQGKIVASGDVRFDEARDHSQEASFSATEISQPPDMNLTAQNISLAGTSDEEFFASAMRNIGDFLWGLQLEHTL